MTKGIQVEVIPLPLNGDTVVYGHRELRERTERDIPEPPQTFDGKAISAVRAYMEALVAVSRPSTSEPASPPSNPDSGDVKKDTVI